jgi:hypothetical protein
MNAKRTGIFFRLSLISKTSNPIALFFTLRFYFSQPVLYRSFPRLAFVGYIFNKASRIKPKPFRKGNVLIVQAALALAVSPLFRAVRHIAA